MIKNSKRFYTQKELTDKEMQEEQILEKIIDCFVSSKPLIDFLNRAIENEYKSAAYKM